jgi:hypothetical protein
MNQPRSQPALRRFGLYGLILLALAMVSGVIFVILTDDPFIAASEAFPEPVLLNPENRPNFVFPESARTYDLSLNQFVDRFARVCMQGRYSDFRLMLSTRRPPILPPRFESNFNALKQVRILGLDRLPEIPGVEGPVYLMRSEYDLQDFAVRRGEKTRQVQVAIAREDGAWKIGPLPREALARLRAYQAAQSQPAAPLPAEANTPLPRTTANRPARLSS